MIGDLILFIIVMPTSIILHEIGHLVLIKKYGGKAELTLNKVNGTSWDLESEDLINLTVTQKMNIIKGGLFLGMLPLGLFLINVNPLFFIISSAFYLYGCRHDLKLHASLKETKEFWGIE